MECHICQCAAAHPLLAGPAVNVIGNATKYAGSCSVDLVDDDCGRAVIHVEDDGPGIADAEKEKVFHPFYRTDGARGQDSGSFGLGLTIAKSIVELHGGEIELRN